jgi:hypothetical protein
MKTFKEFIIESTFKDKVKGTLATAMLATGAINTTGIPIAKVPGIVHDYWQERIAPTPKQQISHLSRKYEKLAKKVKGQRILNIDSIPDENDKQKFIKLVTGQNDENI